MSTRKKKILIVEDDGAVINSIREELKERYHLKTADSYNSALGIWEEEKPSFDCIVLDLNIGIQLVKSELIENYYPLIGLGFLEEVKKFCPDIYQKTIIYSGYLPQLKIKCVELGLLYDDLNKLSKTPNSIREELIEKIERICQ